MYFKSLYILVDNYGIILSTIVKKKQVNYSLHDMLTRLFNNIIVYHVMSKCFQ